MITEHFVTLFNSKFLPQGLTLYSSLRNLNFDFKLWVICIDQKCFNILNDLNNDKLIPILLEDHETEELKLAKTNRNFTEYCWTLTPISFKIVFQLDSDIARLTYLDADLFFFESPAKIFEEFDKSGKSVLITKHNYSPFYDHSKESGKYCVQFLTISRILGEEIRLDWELKCLKWCYNKFEDGKFGDQKYLDYWLNDFPGKIHVLNDQELILAPWNILKYSFCDIVVYHFHGLRILNNNKINIGNYVIPKAVYKNVYSPYISELQKNIALLKNAGFIDVVQQKLTISIFVKSFLSVPYFLLDLIKFKHIIKYEKT